MTAIIVKRVGLLSLSFFLMMFRTLLCPGDLSLFILKTLIYLEIGLLQQAVHRYRRLEGPL